MQMLQVALYPTIRLSSRALSVGYEHFFQEFPTDSSHLATFPENPPSRSGAYLSKCPILCPVTQAGNSGIILTFPSLSFPTANQSPNLVRSTAPCVGAVSSLPGPVPPLLRPTVNFWVAPACGLSPSDPSSTFRDTTFLNCTYNHLTLWPETLLGLPAAITLPEHFHPVP